VLAHSPNGQAIKVAPGRIRAARWHVGDSQQHHVRQPRTSTYRFDTPPFRVQLVKTLLVGAATAHEMSRPTGSSAPPTTSLTTSAGNHAASGRECQHTGPVWSTSPTTFDPPRDPDHGKLHADESRGRRLRRSLDLPRAVCGVRSRSLRGDDSYSVDVIRRDAYGDGPRAMGTLSAGDTVTVTSTGGTALVNPNQRPIRPVGVTSDHIHRVGIVAA